jgi:hypothetical protein
MGGSRIEEFRDQVVNSSMKTDRDLADYMKYLDIPEEQMKDWRSSIMVVGGGDSPLASQLKERGLQVPCVNIDPCFPQHNPLNETQKHPWNFLDSKVTGLLKQQKFDEAWALFSLPMYALSPNDITQFYRQALTGLNTNGILRVFPYNDFSRSSNFVDGVKYLHGKQMKQTAEQIVKAMKTRPDLFDVVLYEKRVKTMFSREGFPTAGVKIRVRARPAQIDQFFRELPPMPQPEPAAQK